MISSESHRKNTDRGNKKATWERIIALIINKFPAYKRADICEMPFVESMNLYFRALELISGKEIGYQDPDSDLVPADNDFVWNAETGRWE